MKLCFNETLDSSNLENDLELCEKYGYDYIEIRLAYLHDYLKNHTMDELKKYFDTHHIKPYGYNSIVDINFCTPEQWEKVKEEFIFACESAKALGGKSIVVVPTCSKEADAKSEKEIFEDSVKALKELSDIAKPYGVMLGFEPIGAGDFCVHSISKAMDIVNAVDRDNVGISVDAFNMYSNNGFKDIDDLRSIPADKICVFHINDSMDLPMEELDTMKHRLYPGEGVIQLKEMVDILKEMGYTEMASLELFGDWMYDGSPEDVIRDGYAKTKAFLESTGIVVG
jgi:2-keto-myo-inositol isomerase